MVEKVNVISFVLSKFGEFFINGNTLSGAISLQNKKTGVFLSRYHGISANRFRGGTDGFAIDV
jgi:hypothetical protein